MEASVLDLRYRTKDILRALKRRESVRVFYRGHLTGVIHPVVSPRESKKKVCDHPFFGMTPSSEISVDEQMTLLRNARQP